MNTNVELPRFFNNSKRGFSMRVLMIFILLLAIFRVNANQPFYFIAKQAPDSSLTSQSNAQSVVYLRWDIIEGQLPADIVQFNLYRDEVLIGEFSATQLLTQQQVSRLYQGSAQKRRLLETMSLLKEESVLDPNLLEIDANDYANVILARIERDEYWAQLASKRDFNIAMARNRGAIDRPGIGSFKYELRAVNNQMQTRRVGLINVDTQQNQNLLPIPDFAQLSLSQCDLPDIKDHYSVALNWSPAGQLNMADRVANELFISGYDIYRTKENVDASLTQAPARDLAQEAARLHFDNQGQVAFADLERVNKTLITVSPDLDVTNPEWLETHEDLELAGLKPEDKRAYYLVPRDFTGNFGPTSATLVTVGDMSRPAAPWDIDIYLSEEEQRVELSFEKVDVDSYLESFGQSKRVCGISDSGAISFVAQDESCAEHRHKIIQTQVSEYLLYRFDNFAEASRFKDSDGDGFSDRVERPSNMQCSAASQVGGSLIESSAQETEFADHTRITLLDEQPALNKGDIYWYRLAAKSPSGRLSFLSEPLRVNFPDRDLPAPPMVTVSYPGDGSEICGCELDYQDNNDPWAFTIDQGLGRNVSLNCNGNSYDLSEKDLASSSSLACNIPNIDISPIATDCAIGGTATTSGGTFSCDVVLPNGSDFCETGNMRIRAVSCGSVDAPAGVVIGPMTVESRASDPDHCVSIFQQIAGKTVKVSSSCGEETAVDTYVVEKGEFCGYSVSHDKNNNVSTTERIECRQVISPNDDADLLAPRIDTMQLGEDFASLNFALPSQQQSILEVEIKQSKPVEGEAKILRVGVASAADSQTTVNVDLPLLSGSTDQWCARARLHSASERVGESKLSSWSKERCDIRSSSSLTQPKWLSWPGLKTANQEADLMVRNNSEFGVINNLSPLLRGLHVPLLTTENICTARVNTVTYVGNILQQPVSSGPALTDTECSEENQIKLLAAFTPQLNFLVFRQSRLGNDVTNFKQVSPLISYVHWATFQDGKGDERFLIRDPYIWGSVPDMSDQRELTLNFVDRAPLLEGREYRYQFLYFDADHALVSWRQTDWILYENTQSPQIAGGI